MSNPQLPTSYEAVRLATISFMTRCLEDMSKFRDRENLKEEIQRLKGSGGGLKTAMKATGVARPADELGRIVIPIELRRVLGIEHGTPIEFFADLESKVIYLQKFNMRTCVICGSSDDITDFKKKHLCETCIGELFEEKV